MRLGYRDFCGMNDFKDLIVWQKSMLLVDQVYAMGKLVPWREAPGFYSQLTRAAISIPANISEGYGRFSTKEYRRFLRISLGSSYELETLLIIGRNRGWFRNQEEQTNKFLKEVQKMLFTIIKRLPVD